MNAQEIIINLIVNKVAMMNLAASRYSKDAFERFRLEAMGMLICLKNINEEDKFYCINYDGKVEFGYYDADGEFKVLSK